MHIEVIETAERVVEIDLVWDELYQRDHQAHFYLSSRFISAIALRTPGRFRLLAAWSEDGHLVGLFPLILLTQWSKTAKQVCTVIDMLGHVFDADYTGFLCDPDCEVVVAKLFADHLKTQPFARMELSFFKGSHARLEAFADVFRAEGFSVEHREKTLNDGQTNNLICPAIALPENFETYLSGLSANSRQKFRRLIRQLDSDPQLRITRSRPETFPQDVNLLTELWFLQYAPRKGKAKTTKLAQQFRETLMAGLASGQVDLFVLWQKGKPVAAQANYIDPVKRTSLFHVGARDDRVRDLASGLMLHIHAIRWAIARGLTGYDFTLGNEAYKYSFGPAEVEIAAVEIATHSGANTTGKLHPGCRDSVTALLKRFAKQGKAEEARIAAAQALEVWPDLLEAQKIEALLNSATPQR